jgi:hypothetical protein
MEEFDTLSASIALAAEPQGIEYAHHMLKTMYQFVSRCFDAAM